MRSLVGALTLACTLTAPSAAQLGEASPAAADREYVAYVVSESADEVARIVFGPAGLIVERQREVSTRPHEVDGPHGVAVSPDGAYYYVTLGHGTPFGSLWKLRVHDDEPVGRVTLGSFPATVDVTPDGLHAFVANFNLHGDHVPSTVSKVHLPTMREVARTETCVMPHGSRVTADGARHYSVCMMDDLLVELDVATGAVVRRFSVAPGAERAVPEPAGQAAHRHGEGGEACSPTWAQPSPDGAFVYVACNRAATVLEIDVGSGSLTRRFSTGANPYNVDVTPDGRLLLITLKNATEPAVEVVDLRSGERLATIATTTTLPHGIAITDDSRYAFVSVEGRGPEPGKVDILDLQALRLVASVEVGQQAAGIAVLRP